MADMVDQQEVFDRLPLTKDQRAELFKILTALPVGGPEVEQKETTDACTTIQNHERLDSPVSPPLDFPACH